MIFIPALPDIWSRYLATPPQSFRVFILWLLIGLSLAGLARSVI